MPMRVKSMCHGLEPTDLSAQAFDSQSWNSRNRARLSHALALVFENNLLAHSWVRPTQFQSRGDMDTNKLTTKSRDAVSAALRTALTEGNPYAEPSHLLHALLQVPGNTAAPLIAAAGADPRPRAVREQRVSSFVSARSDSRTTSCWTSVALGV
jgi:hypothetical protein